MAHVKSNSEIAATQAAFTLVWLYIAGMSLLVMLGVGMLWSFM